MKTRMKHAWTCALALVILAGCQTAARRLTPDVPLAMLAAWPSTDLACPVGIEITVSEEARNVTCSGGDDESGYLNIRYSNVNLYYNCPDGLPCVPMGDGTDTPPLCFLGDLDWNGVVDLEDFKILQLLFTEPTP